MTQRGRSATKVGMNHGFADFTDREREMRLDFIRAIRVIRKAPSEAWWF
jgi:hypothetical protein